jgi:mono/diheme cytochrome c family protein
MPPLPPSFRTFARFLLFLGSIPLPAAAAAAEAEAPAWPKVEEVLATRCVECHGANEAKGGLRLHARQALLSGGDSGAAVDATHPGDSLLLERIKLQAGDDERMPPAGKQNRPGLTPEEISLLEKWVHAGAPWPEGREIHPRRPGELEAALALPIRELAVFPKDIKLEHPEDHQGIVVIATLEDGTQRDCTHFATLSLASPYGNAQPVAKLEGSRLVPLNDGKVELIARLGTRENKTTVEASRMGSPRPLRFAADVLPVLTRFGCNSGGCHGSARGQDGFHISLFGYDPKADYDALTRQMIGRRVNNAVPEESLLLTKSVGAAPHGGGKRFSTDDEAYRVIRDWIALGATPDPADSPEPERISIEPEKLLLAGENRSIPLRVRAHYKDGSDRDVTSLAVFSTSNPDAAAVDEHGLLTSRQRGEAFVMARFHTFTEGVEVIVIPENTPYQRVAESGGNVVDKFIGDKLERLRITPSPLASDPVFLRRATLDINGRLPTLEEQDAFLADTSPDKRAKLIDRLLERPEFAQIWVMRWAELLQIRTNNQTGVSYKAALLYFTWLQERMSRNIPLDQIVRELLGATGGTFANPAGNFYKSEMDMLKFSENVAQAFLGTRLQCAQCHNHPFDRWTMDDYYGWASFFSQVGKKKGHDPRETVVFNRGSGGVQHPVGKRDVPPKFLGGTVPDVKGKDRRVVLADWLTAPDNPYFSRNIANIVWSHHFGIGIVEPVDDMRLSNPPSNPELLDALAARLRDSKYDLRDLVRLIANSHAYQRVTTPNETNLLDERNFSRALVRRMRAEILQDVLADQAGTQNKFKGLPLGARAVQIADGNTSNYFLTTFGRATRATVCSCEVKLEPNLSQALHLINGEMTHQRVRKGGLIQQWTDAKKSPDEIVTLIYRRALCRPPTSEETKTLLKDLPDKPESHRAYLEDIFWAVLNSKEFVFNH